MSYYVERRDGAIVGAFRNPQQGIAEELLPDTHPELVAFFSGPSEAERLAATRAAALTGLLTRADDIGIAVRATVAAITFLINERLQHFNAQIVALSGAAYPEPVRVLQADVLAYLMANPTAGDPAT